MKAITCSQCGALIKGISAKKEFADCRYCGAEIPIQLEKIFEVPDKPDKSPKNPEERKVTVYKSVFEEEAPYLQQEPGKVLKGVNVAATLIVIITLAIILYSAFSKDANTKTKAIKTPNYIAPTPPTYQKPETPTATPTPFPDFSYRAYVRHFTDIGAEHIEIPEINAEQLPTMDLVELKKTVFKQKRIKVRITINPDGEVIEAKALNGHPALQEICLIAAKKSLFTTRKKNSTTDLTYIFVIEE